MSILPDEIGDVDLEQLDVSDNKLSSLPYFSGDYGYMDHKLKIDLSNNPLTKYPESLSNRFIYDLNINYTDIDYLPPIKFFRMRGGRPIGGHPYGLELLQLRGTPISEFPDLSNNISYMDLLDIRDTKIKEIPDYIKEYSIDRVFISDLSLADSFGPNCSINPFWGQPL